MPRQPKMTPCSVAACDRAEYARTWCRVHYKRMLKHGDLLDRKRRWHGDQVTYAGMHKRIRSWRGSAAEHACVDCAGPAQEWSYDQNDPNEKRDAAGAYSTDVSHYSPRCVRCHRAFDRHKELVSA